MERLLAYQVWEGLGEKKTVTFPYKDVEISFFLPDGWFDLIQRHILLERSFYEIRLLEVIRGRVGKHATFIDAGANIGNHSIFFGKICQADRVYAFEPIPHMRNLLQHNIALNHAESVTVMPYALGAVSANAEVDRFNSSNLGSTALVVSGLGSIKVRPLDSFGIENVDLIKIDVEGAQDLVIKGATSTIERSNPILVIESFERDGERERTFALLERIGYTVDEVVGHNIIAVPNIS